MTDALPALATALASYLVGGIPFGYLLARARGVDLFTQGSGNIGATNVARVLGRKFGMLAFALDFAKGAVPVALALVLAPNVMEYVSRQELGVLAGLAAIIGHLFSVYLRFRGGKGVATAAGVVLVLLPVAALVGLVVWFGVVAASRYVSAGSLAAAVALVAVRLWMTAPDSFARDNLVLTVFCFVAAGLVFVRHRANLARLWHGNENRISEGGMMLRLTRIVHVLSLGLWFGTLIFFSFVVGLSLFGAMDDLVQNRGQYPWFGVPQQFQIHARGIDGPKEYGSRTAGVLISPMFAWFFVIQGVCGFLAVATAWRWQQQHRQRVHSLRVTLLLIALATVILGWPLERHVHDLRAVRQEKMDVYFHDPDSGPALAEAMSARATFGQYHMYSLFLNFATVALVTVGMGMAAFLPPLEDRVLADTAGQAKPERDAAKAPG